MTHHLPTLALACAVMSAQAQVVENQQITQVPAVYRFGIDTRWAYAYVPRAAQCNRLAFGGSDPAPGVVKKCEPVQINLATCVLPVMGGSGVNPDFSFSATSGGWMSWWCPSAKGPQLRIVAGGIMASIVAAKCFATSSEAPSKTLARCAPGKVTDPGIRVVWEPSIGQILATVPK